MADRPALTPRQQKAAQLLGQGFEVKYVARESGVSEKSVGRWKKREDFAELARQSREAVLDANPTARATLEAALSAVTRAGAPDWKIRVAAASLLITGKADGPGEPEIRTTRVYLPPEPEEEEAA